MSPVSYRTKPQTKANHMIKKAIRQIEAEVKDLPKTGYGFNVLLVTSDGSYISTQIWRDRYDNTRGETAEWILENYAKGQNEDDSWAPVIVHAFVKPHEFDECYHFDLQKPEHVFALTQLQTVH